MPRVQGIPIAWIALDGKVSLSRVRSNEDQCDALASRSIHCPIEVSIIQTMDDGGINGVRFGSDGREWVD